MENLIILITIVVAFFTVLTTGLAIVVFATLQRIHDTYRQQIAALQRDVDELKKR